MKFNIDPDIKKAETLPSSFYRDEAVFESLKTKVFARSWHLMGEDSLFDASNIHPINLYEGYLSEPLLLVKNKEEHIQCLSNVCTHRANMLAQIPKQSSSIVCQYHGRKFDLNGRYQSMPEFEQAEDFPRDCDHLKAFPTARWHQFIFSSLEPAFEFQQVISILEERVGHLPLQDFHYRGELSKNYLVNAHWALYCDNYLEGFHIPFVHKDLHEVLDYGSYDTLLFDHCSLQIGYSQGGEEVFSLPETHVDHGKQVAAYYFWIFPNLMLNFYPWGLSVNIVSPISPGKTQVKFLTYVYDASKLEKGAGAMLDKVEREDEFVVEGVQKGMSSTAYTTGRFSPTREKGVHHFHRLLAQFIN